MTDTVAEATQQSPKIPQIVERYMQLRDKKAQLKAAYELELEPIEAAMEKVETFFLKQMQDMGVDSLKTPFGTIYQTTKTSTSVADWDSVLNWVRENDEWTLLTRGVSKDFVKAYKEENQDLPPGVNWREERSVNIRKA